MKTVNNAEDRADLVRRLKTVAPGGHGEKDVQRLCGLMGRFAEPGTKVAATHPAFGSMTWASGGILAYKHIDDHLRQFGA